jgi:hypothetical protein
MNALRQRWPPGPPRGLRPPDIIAHYQTLAAQEPMPQRASVLPPPEYGRTILLWP